MEVLENIVNMMHNAPEKRLKFAYIIEEYREDGLIHLLSVEKLKALEKDIKRTLSTGLN